MSRHVEYIQPRTDARCSRAQGKCKSNLGGAGELAPQTCNSDLGRPLAGTVQNRLLHRRHMARVRLGVDPED